VISVEVCSNLRVVELSFQGYFMYPEAFKNKPLN